LAEEAKQAEIEQRQRETELAALRAREEIARSEAELAAHAQVKAKEAAKRKVKERARKVATGYGIGSAVFLIWAIGVYQAGGLCSSCAFAILILVSVGLGFAAAATAMEATE
jgi:hypothetical protein